MKKLSAAFLTAVLVTVSMAASTGNAGASDTYITEGPTTCGGFVVGKPHHRTRSHVRADVDAPNTSRQAKGFLNVEVRKFNGADGGSGRYFTRGGHVDLFFGPLKPGRYFGSVVFDPRPTSSPFTSCHDGFFFTVHRGR